MGFFDFDSGPVLTRRSSGHHSSSKHHKSSKRSRSNSRSPTRSFFGVSREDGERHSKHNSSRSSFFGMPNVSTRSFFGLPEKHRSSSSYYKRSSRPGFMNRAYRSLRRLLRDLVYYAKRHPVKVFVLVIMPLITGGALTALLARFGLRMPPTLERMLGIGAKAVTGDSIGLVGEAVRMVGGGHGGRGSSVGIERGRDGGLAWERKSWESSGFGGRESDSGWGEFAMKNIGKFF